MEEENQDFSFFIHRENNIPLEPAGNFADAKKSPFQQKTIVEHLERRVSGRMVSALEDIFETPLFGVSTDSWHAPPHWRHVLNTLYQRGITASPEFHAEMPYNDMPKSYIFGLRAAEGSLFAKTKAFIMGSSFNCEDARAKTMGEFLERHALLPHPEYPAVRASIAHFEKNGKAFLDPASVAGAFFYQGKSMHVSNKDEFMWVRGNRFPEGSGVFLPAQLVFWHHGGEIWQEPQIREQNSNGAAGMFSRERAILAGIYELIQRDAFLIFWLNHVAPPRIIPESIEHEDIAHIVQMIRKYDFEVEILDITSDFGVPAFTAVLLDGAGERKRLAIGAGCNANAEEAIKSALVEAIAIFHFARKHRREVIIPESFDRFEKNIGQQERMQIWSNPAMFPRFAWFLKGERRAFSWHKNKYGVPSGIQHELSFLANQCKKRGPGYEIFYFEAKNEILRIFGYHAVKVIIPALVPLYLCEFSAPLTAERLREIPHILGYRDTHFPEPLPHPFT